MVFNREDKEREVRAFLKYKNIETSENDIIIEGYLDLFEYGIFYYPEGAPEGSMCFTDKFYDILKEECDYVFKLDDHSKTIVERSLLKYFKILTIKKKNLYVSLLSSYFEFCRLDDWIDTKKYKRHDENG